MIKKSLTTTELNQAVKGYIKGGEAIKKDLLYFHTLKRDIALENGFSTWEEYDEEKNRKNIEFLERELYRTESSCRKFCCKGIT